MGAAVLEFLANGAGGFGGTGRLQLDDLDQVRDAAEVIFFDGFAGEPLDGDGDGRVGFLLVDGVGVRNWADRSQDYSLLTCENMMPTGLFSCMSACCTPAHLERKPFNNRC